MCVSVGFEISLTEVNSNANALNWAILLSTCYTVLYYILCECTVTIISLVLLVLQKNFLPPFFDDLLPRMTFWCIFSPSMSIEQGRRREHEQASRRVCATIFHGVLSTFYSLYLSHYLLPFVHRLFTIVVQRGTIGSMVKMSRRYVVL